MHTQTFDRVYLRTLRQIYDTEKQLVISVQALRTPAINDDLRAAMSVIQAQSARQLDRLADVFRLLYQEARGEASWVATALLREAWESASDQGESTGTEGCAAALLALKRYELTLYEALLRWSEKCDLYEALPVLRRCIAEELLQASILSDLAFEASRGADTTLAMTERRALH